jgi:arsenate reductase
MRTLLFVCEFNACRSQLAEGVARSLVPADWRVLSAGLTRTGISPEVVAALNEIAIDPRGQSSKSIADVRHEHVDDVFVLARPAVEGVRTTFPAARLWDWSIDDPLRVPGGPDRVRAAVCSARDDLKHRLQDWLTHDADQT